MKSLGYLLGALALALAIYLAVRSQRVLESGLPPREQFHSLAAAEAAAKAYQEAQGGNVIGVRGTGSQAPYIPPAPAGLDRYATLVAYVVTRPGVTFSDITSGALCIYFPVWNSKAATMHQAAQLTSQGWVMSGLNNERSESWERMTAENFGGVIARAFVVVP